VPTIFISALFPALSRTYAQGSNAFGKIAGKGLDLMLLCSVPIGLGLFVIANPLVLLLLGETYAPSGPITAAMGIALIVTYQTSVLGQFLVATDRLSTWMVVMAAGIVATIGLDLILIPWCELWLHNGAIGGALSYIIVETLMVVAGYALIPKESIGWRNLWFAVRVFGAGLVMTVVTWPFRDQFILIPIAIGAIIYVGLIAAMRVVAPEDIRLLSEIAQRKLGRFIKLRKATPASTKGPQ
jgi:O-antigen/teichoic acid export membrane protein